MASAAQIHANIHNAQSSTGPITEEGKARSSQNAVKHGLSSGHLFLEGEDPAPYYEMKRALRQEHCPEGRTEEFLVEQMATALWLVRRAVGLQTTAFNNETTGQAPKSLAIYIRYQTTNERAFHKALDTLRKLKVEKAEQRKAEQIGFVLHSSPEDFVAQMAEAYKIRNDGDELPPEFIEAMLHRSRNPENTRPHGKK